MPITFYWHDYETFGADPQRDRPAQFAGIRTDLDMNILSDPLVLYCQPAEDMLPQPEACLITGITPQKARAEGVVEAEFIRRIHREFSQPETCVVGYNNIRFDDEVTRHTLYRNLFDPYAREWQNGNSRWDVIDMVRLAYALRPEGIEWPLKEDGTPSFRLEDLTRANGIVHEAAHDAMSDVFATIAVAKLIKERQPKLFNYVFENRGKQAVLAMLDIKSMKPLFHVSSKYPARLRCGALVAPIAQHPENPNAVLVYDLRVDPSELAMLSVEQIRERIFTARSDMDEGVERIPIKAIHVNKCPIVAPAAMLKTLSSQRLAEMELDGDQLRENLRRLRSIPGLAQKITEVFRRQDSAQSDDPDLMLYSGGFFSPRDRQLMDFIHTQPPDLLGELDVRFEDPRLEEMLFRFRARNYPGTLNADEVERWEQYRFRRLTDPEGGGSITLQAYFSRIEELMRQPNLSSRDRHILEELYFYGESIIPA